MKWYISLKNIYFKCCQVAPDNRFTILQITLGRGVGPTEYSNQHLHESSFCLNHHVSK